MNGRRARAIRRMAWDAATEAGVRTGDPRFLRARNLRTLSQRIKRFYVRHGRYPTEVTPDPGAAPRSVFGR